MIMIPPLCTNGDVFFKSNLRESSAVETFRDILISADGLTIAFSGGPISGLAKELPI